MNVYVISAEYGQWEDHCSAELYVSTGEVADAMNRLESMKDEFAAAFAHMIEGMCHGIDPNDSITTFQGDEHVADVALRGTWDNGVCLVLRSMPVGETFSNAEFVWREAVAFYPEGWDRDRVEREGEELVASKSEQLAQPFEQRFEGWKHA